MSEKERFASVEGVHLPKTQLGLSKMNTLVDVAEKLFAKNSFSGTSISDICAGADAAVGTFYIYFDSKTALYRYLVERYKHEIRRNLAESIKNCTTRYDREKEGIKSFVRYSVKNPNVYNIIWGSMSVDKQIFIDYYVSFAKNYTASLKTDSSELSETDLTTLAYTLMGITNFVGLRAIFENMTDAEINGMIDESVMPILSRGMFKTEQ